MTVSESEKAFSKLGNQSKTWHRASTGQEQFNYLVIYSIENILSYYIILLNQKLTLMIL